MLAWHFVPRGANRPQPRTQGIAFRLVLCARCKARGRGVLCRIVAWRTKPGPGNQNPEAGAYKSAGLPYGPRQAPFQNVAELRLVRNLPPALVSNALAFVTVFNGQEKIDVNVAEREVIAALPGINPNAVADIAALTWQ